MVVVGLQPPCSSSHPLPPPLPPVPYPQPRGMAPQVSFPTLHITVYVLAMIHRVFRPVSVHSWPSCPSRFSLPTRNPASSVWCTCVCHLHLTMPEVALQSVRPALSHYVRCRECCHPLVCVRAGLQDPHRWLWQKPYIP